MGLALHLLGHRGCHCPQRGGMVPWRSTVVRPASQKGCSDLQWSRPDVHAPQRILLCNCPFVCKHVLCNCVPRPHLYYEWLMTWKIKESDCDGQSQCSSQWDMGVQWEVRCDASLGAQPTLALPWATDHRSGRAINPHTTALLEEQPVLVLTQPGRAAHLVISRVELWEASDPRGPTLELVRRAAVSLVGPRFMLLRLELWLPRPPRVALKKPARKRGQSGMVTLQWQEDSWHNNTGPSSRAAYPTHSHQESCMQADSVAGGCEQAFQAYQLWQDSSGEGGAAALRP